MGGAYNVTLCTPHGHGEGHYLGTRPSENWKEGLGVRLGWKYGICDY